jgi:hypothetical protein
VIPDEGYYSFTLLVDYIGHEMWVMEKKKA